MATGGFAGTCAALGGVPLILEAFVAFEREISVIAARGLGRGACRLRSGREVHRDGILHTSTVPAGIRRKPRDAAQAARRNDPRRRSTMSASSASSSSSLADGSLLVNEIAPRVHNSGHWTEAVCDRLSSSSISAPIAGWPLGDRQPAIPTA